jgi:beta-galactosidase
VPLDYVHLNEVTAESLRQYKLVYLPYPVMLPSRSVEPLREYVRNGGALVVEARAGWQNERAFASDTIPGMGLHEVLGCRETDVQTGLKGRTAIRWSNGDLLPARWFEETLEPVGAEAKSVATFEDGRVAAVESKYGKGKTLTIGSFVAAAYTTTPDPAVERWFRGLLDWAGVTIPVKTTGAPVEVRWTESGAERIVFVFNHSKQAAKANVNIARGVDLVTGKQVAGDVELSPGEVAVVKSGRM